MDAATLKALILSQRQQLLSQGEQLLHKDEQLLSRNHEIEHLKLMIVRLPARMLRQCGLRTRQIAAVNIRSDI
jgi:hypothetical protein